MMLKLMRALFFLLAIVEAVFAVLDATIHGSSVRMVGALACAVVGIVLGELEEWEGP